MNFKQLQTQVKHGSSLICGDEFKNVDDLCWKLREAIAKHLHDEY